MYHHCKPLNKLFLSVVDSPSPDRYNSKSIFEAHVPLTSKHSSLSKAGKKSFCFGAGREDVTKTSVVNRDKIYPDPIVPGPGTYTDKTKEMTMNSAKYSLAPRTIYLDDESMARKRGVPGPGSYEDQTKLDPVGKYPISDHT